MGNYTIGASEPNTAREFRSSITAVSTRGVLHLALWNDSCEVADGTLISPPITVTVTVAPSYDDFLDHGTTYSPREWQPPQVVEVLGPNFENVTSDQLQDVGGLPVLSASARYTLPADTCVGKLVPVPGDPGNIRRVPV